MIHIIIDILIVIVLYCIKTIKLIFLYFMNKSNLNTIELEEKVDILIKALGSMSNQNDLKKLILDLCTPSEIEALSGRLLSVDLINKKVPYRKINSKIGVSLVTLSRVSRALKYGSGGYKLFLDKLKNT